MGTLPSSAPQPATPSGPSGTTDPGTEHRADAGSTTSEALGSALDRLVSSQVLTAEQARAVLRELHLPASQPGSEPRPGAEPGVGAAAGGAPPGIDTSAQDGPGGRSWTAVLGEVGGYVGAAFVVGGCLIIAGPSWDTLSRVTRTLVLAGPALAVALVAAAVAVTAPGGWSARGTGETGPRRRLVATLSTVVAALAAAATGQVVGDPDRALAVSGAAAMVSALGYAACRSNLLHLALGVSFALTAAQATDRFAGADSGDGVAWVLVAAGLVWLGLTAAAALAERTLGVVFGAALVYLGGEVLALGQGRAAGYLVVGLLAVSALAGYLRSRQIAVLVVGVVALATVVPQVVDHYTGDSLHSGGALLVTGLSIIGASGLGLLLHRRPTARREAG